MVAKLSGLDEALGTIRWTSVQGYRNRRYADTEVRKWQSVEGSRIFLEIRKHRNTEIQEYRNTGIQEYRNTDLCNTKCG